MYHTMKVCECYYTETQLFGKDGFIVQDRNKVCNRKPRLYAGNQHLEMDWKMPVRMHRADAGTGC